jgi:dihydroxyacetone kinase-like protein
MDDLKKTSRRINLDLRSRITSDTLRQWMEFLAADITEAEPWLTELDSAIGDADHGINMKRGMNAVREKLEQLSVVYPSGQLRIVSTTLMSAVGGASGPLYGAFFLQSSHHALNRADWGLSDLTAAMEAGYRGVVQLGKAAVGDKTMVDTLAAAVQSLRTSCTRHESLPLALENCHQAALKAAEDTAPMIARKGRASYLGERSAGTQDPGATSAVFIFDSLSRAVAATSPLPANQI